MFSIGVGVLPQFFHTCVCMFVDGRDETQDITDDRAVTSDNDVDVGVKLPSRCATCDPSDVMEPPSDCSDMPSHAADANHQQDDDDDDDDDDDEVMEDDNAAAAAEMTHTEATGNNRSPGFVINH